MEYISKLKSFIDKPFFHKYNTLFCLWIFLGVISWCTKFFPFRYNNFLIFKTSFWHLLEQMPLYNHYPAEYDDVFLYGPFFALTVSPFAIMPVWLGFLSWQISLAIFLFIATLHLPFEKRKILFILWFCSHELLTGLFMSQMNIGIVALIMLSFICIEKEKDIWATFFIMAGTFIKIYGIVGLAFFFFSKHKMKFILSCIGWAFVMFASPMIISGSGYIIEQYKEWFQALTSKNEINYFARLQNISFLGMVRKISGSSYYLDIYLIIPGLVLFGLPYLRFAQYKYAAFRQTILASVLMFVVLFSTGSESSTYIIAFMGVAIWYVAAPWKRDKWDIGLMIFAFILTSMSPSDLFPAYIRKHIVQPYALKALPCMLIWLKLTYELCLKDYAYKRSSTQA